MKVNEENGFSLLELIVALAIAALLLALVMPTDSRRPSHVKLQNSAPGIAPAHACSRSPTAP